MIRFKIFTFLPALRLVRHSAKRVSGSFSVVGCFLWLILFTELSAAEKPANIAIIDLDGGHGKAVDILTAELSQQKNLIILERSEIDKILAEHKIALSNVGSNYLEVARLLKADGLILNKEKF